jgi:hypothetical protein
MNELQELEARERLQAALDSGNELAELEAREALASLIGQQPAQGMSVPQAIAEYSPGAIAGETALAVGSGIAGQIVGGLSGLGALAGGASPQEAGQRVRDVSGAMTYEPRTAGGQMAIGHLERLGRALEFIEQQSSKGAGAIGYAAGLQDTPDSPASQTIGEVVPAIAGMVVPGGQARRVAAPAPVAAARGEAGLQQVAQGVRAAESAPVGSGARAGAIEDLAVRAELQPDVARAFEESGIPPRQVPAEVLSGSQEFRQVAGGARSVPASPAAVQYRDFLNDVSRRVDDMAADAGAESTGSLNLRVAETLQKNIDDARKAERQAYGVLEGVDGVPGLISPTSRVDVSPIFDVVMKRLDDVGGDGSQLSAADRRMLGRVAVRNDDGSFTPKEMTFAGLTNLRKELNAARSGKGGFMNAADFEVEQYANAVSAATRKNAEDLGRGDAYAAAMEATGVKKRAQEAAQALLGKKLEKSFSAVMDARVDSLRKGRIAEFNKAMDSVPPELRTDAATSYVFGKIIDQSNMESRLNISGFNKFYNELSANPDAKAALYRHLEPETRKTVENIGKMTSAIKRANEDFIATGRLQTLDQGFKLADSFVGKLGRFALASKIPGGGIVADAASGAMAKNSRRLEVAASDLMGSPDFHGFVANVIADPTGAKARAAERALTKSAPWRKFYVALPQADRTAIRNGGAIAWLQSQEPEIEQ